MITKIHIIPQFFYWTKTEGFLYIAQKIGLLLGKTSIKEMEFVITQQEDGQETIVFLELFWMGILLRKMNVYESPKITCYFEPSSLYVLAPDIWKLIQYSVTHYLTTDPSNLLLPIDKITL